MYIRIRGYSIFCTMSGFTKDELTELFIDIHLDEMIDLHDQFCSKWQEFGFFHESKSPDFIHAIMDCISFESIQVDNEDEYDYDNV
jgi:hypothetical protein